ncbi:MULTISPECIES: glycosyltransferase [unclassified Sphingomonas]|uniref:glycosyltransferase n=1 Tax=unclassified Sphingomonas TaxID=196159 RepID=UPI000AED049D|nr:MULTISPECIES: glycosyltransferase [unclassified Sphingomonas]
MIAIAICIPVQNEEEELPKLFDALDALGWNGRDSLNICLMLDGCVDASADIALAYQGRSKHRVTIKQEERPSGNVGIARHRAMKLGLRALGIGEGLLLSTDADSTPGSDWLSAMLNALHRADVVVGKIVRVEGSANLLQNRVEAYYDRMAVLRRRLDPVPWEAASVHHHVGGANIGIRAEVYRSLGGFAPLPNGEDARLIDDAARAGFRVRRDAACIVHTSARHVGRASGGLADVLRALKGAEAETIQVAHPGDMVWQYRRQAEVRAAHALDRLDLAAAVVGLTHDHVRGVARDCPNAEAFAMRIVPEPPGGMRTVSLAVAERELDFLTGCERAI